MVGERHMQPEHHSRSQTGIVLDDTEGCRDSAAADDFEYFGDSTVISHIRLGDIESIQSEIVFKIVETVEALRHPRWG